MTLDESPSGKFKTPLCCPRLSTPHTPTTSSDILSLPLCVTFLPACLVSPSLIPIRSLPTKALTGPSAMSILSVVHAVVASALFLLCLCPSFSSVAAQTQLTVHLVPHTHDDVGWQITVDEYYTREVRSIINTVVEQLNLNPARRFIYVEQAFFQRWMREATDDQKASVRKLVANGQLEFINGGWCMHDEASTHYVDMSQTQHTLHSHTFHT